ncbi:MAG: SprB repeat-containing protein [Flavobacteriales bacterium]|nr:SprB repeat-containing protein [Flavobacteriales bacterium]
MTIPAWGAAAPPVHVSLTRSDYHGFGVSCFGMKDGTLLADATGGAPPYEYKWSNGQSGASLAGLAAGYYRVDVYDAHGEQGTAEITLEQPLPMKLDVDVYEYSNGYNISCYDCNNGNAAVVVMGGAAPFTVGWSDGPTGANRYNLGPRDYKITVADANGCEGANTTIYLRGPAPSNWGMGGNAGTVPGTNYLGTADNKDLVLKANGQEGLRLTADGKIKIWGNDTVTGVLYRDEFGVVKGGGMSTALGEVMGISSTGPCTGGEGDGVPYWRVHGNDFTYLCDEDPRPLLGTLNFEDLPFHTNGVERMRITKNGLITTRGTAGTETVRIQGDGKVKIGTTADAGLLNVGGALMVGTTASEGLLNVGGGLLVRDGTDGDIVTSSSASTGPVLWARNNQAAWGLSIDQNGKGHILGDWNNPHPIMTFAYDKVGIGTEDMPNDDYSLFVGKGNSYGEGEGGIAEHVRMERPCVPAQLSPNAAKGSGYLHQGTRPSARRAFRCSNGGERVGCREDGCHADGEDRGDYPSSDRDGEANPRTPTREFGSAASPS